MTPEDVARLRANPTLADLPLVLDALEAAAEERDNLVRELGRHTSGAQVEGDYVDALELATARAEAAEAALAKATRPVDEGPGNGMSRAREVIDRLRDMGGEGGTMVAFPFEALHCELAAVFATLAAERAKVVALSEPTLLVLTCPLCRLQHIDQGEWATTRHHRKHQCVDGQFGKGCGHIWAPSDRNTVGVTYQEIAAARARAKGE